MARVLVVHRDGGARQMTEAMLRPRHTVTLCRDYVAALRAMRVQRPAIVVAGIDADHHDAILLLRHIRELGIRLPVVVLAGRGAGPQQPLAMKLGAAAFLEHPVDVDRLTQAVDAALDRAAKAADDIPAVTDEEAAANLTELEKQLNARMKCFAGKNLVYLQSFIGMGTRSRPRICLKCPLRKEYGLSPNVYYEFIRDVCCSDPAQCEAFQKFQSERNP